MSLTAMAVTAVVVVVLLQSVGVLQCAAVCCSVLQCVAVCCSVLQCVAVCCSMLQCVAVTPASVVVLLLHFPMIRLVYTIEQVNVWKKMTTLFCKRAL